MSNEKELAVKVVLDAWHARIKDADALLNELTDEQLQNEVSPGRNRGTYILGHLTAVHDRMVPLLNFGQQQYPQLDEIYLTNPDRAVEKTPTVAELRSYWKNVNSKLASQFSTLKTDDWFQKHNSVSAEDFVKEPHRNKLNIVLGRTNHIAMHAGQLVFLKPRKATK